MATLYVENFPDDRYEALRQRAKKNGKSMAAQVIELMAQLVPTEAEMKKRLKAFKELERIRALEPLGPGPFPTAEEMIREDRER